MSVSGYEKRAVELGARIKAEIRKAGYSQVAFAEMVGLLPSRLSNYITGARMPDVFTLQDIAKSLGVNIDYFYAPENYSDKAPKRYILTVFNGDLVSINPAD